MAPSPNTPIQHTPSAPRLTRALAIAIFLLATSTLASAQNAPIEYDYEYINSLDLAPAPDPTGTVDEYNVVAPDWGVITPDTHLAISPLRAVSPGLNADYFEATSTSPEYLASGCPEGFALSLIDSVSLPGAHSDFGREFWNLSAAFQIYGAPWSIHQNVVTSTLDEPIYNVGDLQSSCAPGWQTRLSMLGDAAQPLEANTTKQEYINVTYFDGTPQVERLTVPENGDYRPYFPSNIRTDEGIAGFQVRYMEDRVRLEFDRFVLGDSKSTIPILDLKRNGRIRHLDTETDLSGTMVAAIEIVDTLTPFDRNISPNPQQNTLFAAAILLIRSDDYGRTWRLVSAPFNGLVRTGEPVSGQLETDGKGGWAFAYSRPSEAAIQDGESYRYENPGTKLFVSTNDAESWTNITRKGMFLMGGGYYSSTPRLHTDRRGNWLILSQIDDFIGNQALLLTYAQGDLYTWSNVSSHRLVPGARRSVPILRLQLRHEAIQTNTAGVWRIFGNLINQQARTSQPSYAQFVLSPADWVAPEVTSITPLSASPIPQGGTAEFEVRTSEFLLGLDEPADVAVLPGRDVTFDSVTVSGGPKHFKVSVSGIAGEGSLRMMLDASRNLYDFTGNRLQESPTSEPVWAFLPSPPPQSVWTEDLVALLEHFATIDGNGNGQLDAEEIAAHFNTPRTDLFEADLDQNQQLSVAELAAWTGFNPYHDADINANTAIETSELLRIIQLYNARGYRCASGAAITEDGFAPGAKSADATADTCRKHAADYNPEDDAINFNELLRIIQFHTIGRAIPCESGEDGFCPAG